MISKNFNFVPLKRFVAPLLLLIVVGFVCSAINSQYVGEEMKFAYNQRALLLITLMAFIAAHLQNKPKVLPIVLNAYLASTLLLYLLAAMGYGASFVHGRIYLFGENPNVLGVKGVLAFLIIMSGLINRFSVKRLIITIPICVPFISLVVLSGSRGAFISMFLGLGVLLFFRKTGVVNKWAIFIFGVFISSLLLTYLLETNPVMAERMMETVETGDTGRNVLWSTAFNIIGDHTLVGAGFTGVKPMMYAYSGLYMNPHNIFLYIFIACGLPGIVLFVMFLLRLVKLLLLHFKRYGDSLNLVIFVIVMFNMSKQGGSIVKILFWFFFAILIGSTIQILSQKGQKRIAE
ncbi:O-antigen ligase family protein [Ulvibacterium sp.]|uniref:O-antigen ligase family protein n=1 Tax=Ulvibacterium sp. TaxID=2665914 RepID=UPI003BAC2606